MSEQLLDEEEAAEAEARANLHDRLPDALTVLTWNVEWAPSKKRDAIRERLAELEADVIVVTEGDRGVLPEGGYCIDGGTDWGYVSPDGERRKVLLWSRYPLLNTASDEELSAALPWGRFASAVVTTSRGPIQFFGVCIPWRNAHVKTGRKDASAWSEHLAYLNAWRDRLRTAARAGGACVLGDFNQRVPRRLSPERVYDALMDWLSGFVVLTDGEVPGLAEPVVDHIAITPDLVATQLRGIDRHEGGLGLGRPLSDHHLVMCRIARRH